MSTPDILQISTLNNDDNDFVAIGYSGYGAASHTAFIVKHNGTLYEIDFTNSISHSELDDNSYYFRITDVIDSDDVPAFLAQCQAVADNARPEYGYFYSGESYDSNGNHISDTDLGQRMTCVGFCLNILKGFLEHDYLSYEDWDSSSHNEEYLVRFCENNNFDRESIQHSHRRITPLEMLCSTAFSSVPISKTEIDSEMDNVQNFINEHPINEIADN